MRAMTTIASGWRSTITATAANRSGGAGAALLVTAAGHERIRLTAVVVRWRCIRIHFVTAAAAAA